MKTGMPDFRKLAEEAKDRISSALPRGVKIPKPSGKVSFSALKNKFSVKGGNFGGKTKGQINLPVFFHTVVAVLICCGVLIAAGFGIYTVEQLEIHDLRADLKAYSEDGVMPATYMNDALSLSVEAVAGRVSALAATVGDGTGISTEELQEINLQLIEIAGESEELSRLVANLHPDEMTERAFSEKVQNPLYDLETVVENLILNNDEIVDASLQNGAATDTGSIKVGKNKKQLPWLIVNIFVVALAIGVIIFLFRKKFFGLFSRKPKTKQTAQSETNSRAGKGKGKGQPRQKSGNRSGSPRRQTGEARTAHTAAAVTAPKTETEIEVGAKAAPVAEKANATVSVSAKAEPEPITEKTAEPEPFPPAEEETVLSPEFPAAEPDQAAFDFDDGDPLSKLAPAFRKMAESEREKSARDPSDGSMSYDESISSLADIAEEDKDDLFASAEDLTTETE